MMDGQRIGGGDLSPAATISVVIPARNAAATVPTTLRSLLPDRDLILEILLVDDASDDDTIDAATETARQHDLPLTVILAKVRSAGAARNIGLSAARGDHVFFLDADDEVVAGGLHRLLATLAGDSHAELAIGCSVRRTDGRPDKPKIPHGYTRDRAANVRNYLTNRLWPIAMGSALLRRDAAAKIRFPEDIALDEDTCFWAAVLASTDVATSGSPVLCYNLDERKMADRFVASPRRDFVNIALTYNRLADRGLDAAALRWRKGWLALRMARQLIKDRNYAMAEDLMRVVRAHPQFRWSFRVLRYSVRIRVGRFASRFRRVRSTQSPANRIFPA
jgi:glycosyltransferase involved in cell wall biosynthesis